MKQASWKFVEKYYEDDLKERNFPETKFYLSWLGYIKGKRILNLGCGPNLYDDVLFFNNFPEEIIGIDINKNNIKFLRESKHKELIKSKNILKNKRVKVKLMVGDITKFNKEFIGKFDCVYAMGVIGMFEKTKLKKLLKIIYSYLKKGGLFLDIDWADSQLSPEKYNERLNYGWYSKKGPTIKKIGKLIEGSSFKILKHKVYYVKNRKDYGWGKIYGYLALK